MKFGMRVAIGVFVTSLAGALFVIKDAGKMEIAEEAGRFLAKESCFCLWNGQEGRYVLAELLGGQSYFEPNQALAESDAGKEKLAVVENRELQEGQIPKPSEPLLVTWKKNSRQWKCQARLSATKTVRWNNCGSHSVWIICGKIFIL